MNDYKREEERERRKCKCKCILVDVLVQVQHDGQLLGVVLADSLAVAQRAAGLVKVQLQDLEPVITIQVIYIVNYFPFYLCGCSILYT